MFKLILLSIAMIPFLSKSMDNEVSDERDRQIKEVSRISSINDLDTLKSELEGNKYLLEDETNRSYFLTYGIENGQNSKARLELFINHFKMNPNTQSARFKIPLLAHYAQDSARTGNYEILKTLLELGAKPDFELSEPDTFEVFDMSTVQWMYIHSKQPDSSDAFTARVLDILKNAMDAEAFDGILKKSDSIGKLKAFSVLGIQEYTEKMKAEFPQGLGRRAQYFAAELALQENDFKVRESKIKFLTQEMGTNLNFFIHARTPLLYDYLQTPDIKKLDILCKYGADPLIEHRAIQGSVLFHLAAARHRVSAKNDLQSLLIKELTGKQFDIFKKYSDPEKFKHSWTKIADAIKKSKK